MSDQKGSVHSHPLQHVLGLLSGEFLVEPRLPQVTVLLGNRETQDLLESRALERVTLLEEARERERDKGSVCVFFLILHFPSAGKFTLNSCFFP